MRSRQDAFVLPALSPISRLPLSQVTNPENIKKSRLKSPECVSRLAKREHVNRFVLFSLPPSSSLTRYAEYD